MNLTDEQLNVSICEWMGWTNIGRHFEPSGLVSGTPPNPHHAKHLELIPNYLSDDSPRRLLNEAEARLTEQQFEDYYEAVESMTPVGRPQHKRRAFLSASARQRTIAILKTVNPEMFQ